MLTHAALGDSIVNLLLNPQPMHFCIVHVVTPHNTSEYRLKHPSSDPRPAYTQCFLHTELSALIET